MYPNPFRKKLGHTTITFDNLTPTVRLRIFKMTGEEVFDKTVDTVDGKAVWPVANTKGVALASGIYIYLVTNSGGEHKTGKIVILR